MIATPVLPIGCHLYSDNDLALMAPVKLKIFREKLEIYCLCSLFMRQRWKLLHHFQNANMTGSSFVSFFLNRRSLKSTRAASLMRISGCSLAGRTVCSQDARRRMKKRLPVPPTCPPRSTKNCSLGLVWLRRESNHSHETLQPDLTQIPKRAFLTEGFTANPAPFPKQLSRKNILFWQPRVICCNYTVWSRLDLTNKQHKKQKQMSKRENHTKRHRGSISNYKYEHKSIERHLKL